MTRKTTQSTNFFLGKAGQQLLMFVVMLLFGFIVMNHVQSVRETIEDRTLIELYYEREAELQVQHERYSKLQEENKTLNQQKNDLIEAMLSREGYDELYEELRKVRLLAGLTETRGPGVMVTMNDKPDYDILKDSDASIVHDSDILHVLDLLKNAGVAALSVNDLRITSVSGVQCIGSTIRCNERRMLPPYVIRAIGQPEQLAAAIDKDEMLSVRQVKEIGLVVSVEMSPEIVIPPFHAADQLGRYITLLEGK
jgi:uncharacterized protein YlxW (UPF0749 family)